MAAPPSQERTRIKHSLETLLSWLNQRECFVQGSSLGRAVAGAKKPPHRAVRRLEKGSAGQLRATVERFWALQRPEQPYDATFQTPEPAWPARLPEAWAELRRISRLTAPLAAICPLICAGGSPGLPWWRTFPC